VTRLDRVEPWLNENAHGDLRDTTTPRAMAGLMVAMFSGDFLSLASRERLFEWLAASETGLDRLRAGLPSSWVVGDKTGSGPNGAYHDVAIALPPNKVPIVIASYMSGGVSDISKKSRAHAEVGAAISREWSG